MNQRIADGVLRSVSYAEDIRPTLEMPTVTYRQCTIGLCWFAILALAASSFSAAPIDGTLNAQVDRYGDPLPVGAVARFGSVRYRGEIARAPEGKSLATIRGNRAVLIDADTCAERKVLPGPNPAEFEVWQLVLSSDGRFIAYGGPGRIEIWNVADAKCIGRYVAGHEESLSFSDRGTRPIAFSPDGKSLLIQILDRNFRVGCWDVAAAEMRWQTDTINPVEHSSRVFGFTNHGQQVVITRNKDKDCHLLLLRTENGDIDQTIELGLAAGHGEGLCCLAPNGEEFAFLEQNEKLRRIELPTGRVKSPILDSIGGYGDISALAYNAEGGKLALIDFFSLRICDTVTGKVLGRTNNSTSIPFGNCRAEFTADGKSIWVVYQEERIWQRFDGFNGRMKKMPEQGHRNGITQIAMSLDGKHLATANDNEQPRIWNVSTAQPMRHALAQMFGRSDFAENSGITSLLFHPDGNLLGTSQGCRIVVWNPETGLSRRSIRIPGDGALAGMALSRDGKWVAVAQTLVDNNGEEQESFVRLFDYASGKEIRKFKGVANVNAKLCFSEDGRFLAISSSNSDDISNIVIVDVLAERIHRTIASDAHAMHFTNHGHTLVFSGPDGVTVWEVASGSPRLKIEPPANDSIDLIALSPDGRTLAGANQSAGTRKIYRWDVRTGETLSPLHGHDHFITALKYAPDGRLISGSQDTTALFWEVRRETTQTIPPPNNDDELQLLWTELSRSAANAHKPIEQFIAAGDLAVRFIEKALRPVKAIDNRMVEKIAERLDASRFADRQRAIAELEAFDTQAEPLLRRIADIGQSAEARRAARRLLERLESPVHSPELVRGLRVIEILQRIGTPAALAQMVRLSKGDPGARLTRVANSAIGPAESATK